MGVKSFVNAACEHRRVLLDTSAVIYFLNRTPGYEALLKPLFSRVEEGAVEAIFSMITEVELLVGPMRSNDDESVGLIRLFLDQFPNVEVAPITREVGYRGAQLRARHGLKLPDALIIATGLTSGCRAVIGNDHSWARVKELPFICLDDFVGAPDK